MLVCDWCSRPGKIYKTTEQMSNKVGDIHSVNLCSKCYRLKEEFVTRAIFEATKNGKASGAKGG